MEILLVEMAALVVMVAMEGVPMKIIKLVPEVMVATEVMVVLLSPGVISR
ncbi:MULTISPECIES: hypothetical protein [unclassified Escherichia]|nr:MULTISPECIES: hypothetical protein [unclassified Escherichia]